jgi:outer membrane scaffolding protein for murein synthesis (MipA/OmpV family)
MQMVNSKQKLVEGPSIIPMAMSNLGVEHYYPKKELSLKEAMIATARETTLDKADTVQAGNTVFLSYKGDKNKMTGRIFNVDTPENFVINMLEYISHLQKKKIDNYKAYVEEALFQALRQLDSILEKTDTDIRINRFKGGEYLMDITVGKDKVR